MRKYFFIFSIALLFFSKSLVAGYGELQFGGLLKIKNNNSSYWKVHSKQITLGYLRYKNKFKQMKVMSELELNDWENDFRPHFSGAYALYDTQLFTFAYSYRNSKLLQASSDPLHLSSPYFWNVLDQKGLTGISAYGDWQLPYLKRLFSINYYGAFGEKYFSSYMASSNSTTEEVEALQNMYAKNDFYSVGGGITINYWNFELNAFYLISKYVYSSSNQNKVNSYSTSLTFKKYKIDFEQVFSSVSNITRIENGQGWFVNFKHTFSPFSFSLNYISFNSNFYTALSRFNIFDIGFRPDDYLLMTDLQGPGFGFEMKKNNLKFKENLFLFSEHTKKVYTIGEIMFAPRDFINLKVLNYNLASDTGVKQSVLFAGIQLEFKFHIFTIFNYKYSIKNDRRLDNLFVEIGYKFAKQGKIFISYGDNGDPQSNPADPGVLLYKIADQTQDSVAIGVDFIF